MPTLPLRRSLLLPVLALALVASACTGRNVAEIPDDRPTPSETPILEPATPNPANEAEIPDDGFPPDQGADDLDEGEDQ